MFIWARYFRRLGFSKPKKNRTSCHTIHHSRPLRKKLFIPRLRMSRQPNPKCHCAICLRSHSQKRNCRVVILDFDIAKRETFICRLCDLRTNWLCKNPKQAYSRKVTCRRKSEVPSKEKEAELSFFEGAPAKQTLFLAYIAPKSLNGFEYLFT